ncbi:MAG TPA: c-type cytochrome [Solirubrobacteraceae bacterium]|nr:c-type cytochrome [Solirubrobacteraceae bacterium]
MSRAAYPFFIVAVVIAIAVPTWIIAENKTDESSAGLGGLTLSAEATKGRVLFGQACATCHTLKAAAAMGRIGPNLDDLIGNETTGGFPAKRALVLEAVEDGIARGNGQMPALLYEGKEAEQVADFVAQAAGH